MGFFDFFRKKNQQKIAFAIIDQAGQTVVWSNDDYKTLMTETYLKNVIAFQCINMISRAVASVPWMVMNKLSTGKAEELPNHDLYTLFKKANIYES